MEIKQKLKELISIIATNDVDINIITDETILTTDLRYDSVQIIGLIVEIENEFNIEIEDDDLDIENLTVFGKLFDIIERKTKG